ncbi:hypothetical protein [Telluria beijingensis]|uniref:hypothetical protein n=1 Tax=Telluria beijingensis TaxID=3068633 RepID=UPI0027952572|nr:hypothetical protein [Massilia sp. REN29]
MRYLACLLLLLCSAAHGSDTPASGTFSNARGDAPDGRYNLVVTMTDEGQQFFVQCFRNGEPAFGTITNLPGRRVVADVDAGPGCPGRKVRIRLDYEEAYIEVKGKLVALPRAEIVIPIVP